MPQVDRLGLLLINGSVHKQKPGSLWSRVIKLVRSKKRR